MFPYFRGSVKQFNAPTIPAMSPAMKCCYKYEFRFKLPDRCRDMIVFPWFSLIYVLPFRSWPLFFYPFAGKSQQGPFNRAYANLFYPNMQEIWPDVYGSAGVRTVEVRTSCICFKKALSRIDSRAVFAHARPSFSSMSEALKIVQCGATTAY